MKICEKNSDFLNDIIVIDPFVSRDIRGSFIKDYEYNFYKKNDIDVDIKEIFYTTSLKGTIRGLHFQNPKPQGKIIRCISGKIFDVIVDLRESSKTFGKYMSIVLSEENHKTIYIPSGFAHGYLVLENSVVSYKCTEIFYKEYDSGILWNDKNINIVWPKIRGVNNYIISNKDLNLPNLKECDNLFI